MCRLFAISSREPLSPMTAIHALNVMKEGHDGSGVGLFLTDLGGAFERFRGAPILSGIFSNEGIRTPGPLHDGSGFYGQVQAVHPSGQDAAPGTPKRDNYLVRVYDYPPDWLSLPREEIELRLMFDPPQAAPDGRAGRSMVVFSFWPDVIMLKEVGRPPGPGGVSRTRSRRLSSPGSSCPGQAEHELMPSISTPAIRSSSRATPP
jgi:hypothetical protein